MVSSVIILTSQGLCGIPLTDQMTTDKQQTNINVRKALPSLVTPQNPTSQIRAAKDFFASDN